MFKPNTVTAPRLYSPPALHTTIIYKVLNESLNTEKLELKSLLKSVAALPCEKQVVNYTAQLIQFKVMKKRLITPNVYEECYFLFFYRSISVMYLKCPPSAHMCVLSRECHW